MGEQQVNLVQLLAWAYLRNARPDSAATLLTALDVAAPGRRKVLRALALAQVRTGEPRAALDTLDRAAAAGSVDAAWHLLRARALAACERRIEAGASMAACLSMRRAALARTKEALQ